MSRVRVCGVWLPLLASALVLLALAQSGSTVHPAGAQTFSPTAALTRLLIAPDSADLAPHSAVAFAYIATASNAQRGVQPETAWIEAVNQSDQPATVADDGTTLTISVPDGFIAVPDADCAPVNGDPASVACPHPTAGNNIPYPSTIAFTAVDVAGAAPLPQSVTVPLDGSATLVADEGLSVAALVVAAPSGVAASIQPPAYTVSWSGQTAMLTALPGYAIYAVDPSVSCGQQRGPFTTLTCATPNGRSILLLVSTGAAPSTATPPPGGFLPPSQGFRHPPTPPPQPEASALSGPYLGVAGQPIEFVAGAQVCCGDTITGEVWSFGDGALAGGDDVSNSYALPGVYTVALRLATEHTTRDIGTTAIVFPADTTPALIATQTQPGSLDLPPGGAVTFDTLDPRLPVPATPVPDMFKSTLIANLSEQTASVSDDGSSVRIDVPAGYAIQLVPLAGDAALACQYGEEPRPTPPPPPTVVSRGPFPATPPSPPTPIGPLVATNDTRARFVTCPAGPTSLVHTIAFTTVALRGG